MWGLDLASASGESAERLFSRNMPPSPFPCSSLCLVSCSAGPPPGCGHRVSGNGVDLGTLVGVAEGVQSVMAFKVFPEGYGQVEGRADTEICLGSPEIRVEF